MPAPQDSFLAALTSLSKDQIKQAGQRYTPGVDPNAPNLRIESLFTAIENVACGAGAAAVRSGYGQRYACRRKSVKVLWRDGMVPQNIGGTLWTVGINGGNVAKSLPSREF